MAVKAKHKKKTAIKIILCVLLVLLLLGGLLAVLRSCNGMRGTSLTFSLLYDGEKVKAGAFFAIDINTDYKFEVVDPLGKALSDGSYNVKIVARTTDNENIYFKVDNMTRTLKDLPDLTEYLVAEKGNDYFVLRLSADLPELLQEIFGDLKIAQAPTFADIDKPIFDMVVTSATGSFSITIPLFVGRPSVSFDITEIVF